MTNVPLANGSNRDAQATAGQATVEVVGQKAIASGRTHLWMRDTSYGRWNVVNKVAIARFAGSVLAPGSALGTSHPVGLWQFNQAEVLAKTSTTITSSAAGIATIDLSAVAAGITNVGIRTGTY